MSRITSNTEFARELDIGPERLSQLCSRYYCIWLFRQIWCYSDASANIKGECFDVCKELIDMKCFTAFDFILTNHPNMLTSWLYLYHKQYHKSYGRLFK